MEAKKTYTVKDVIIFLKDMRADNEKRLNDMYVEQVKLRGEFDTLKKVAENKNVSGFGSGDTVGVYVKVREGDKERIQLYKGVCIKVQGKGTARTFTVRKISAGVGVERTFPFRSPSVDRVEVISHGKVRRAKLYFLRDLKGKAARLTSELVGLRDDSAAAAAPVVDDAGTTEQA